MLLVTIIVVPYAFVGGAFGWLFYKTSSQRCKKCRNHRHCSSNHGIEAGFIGLGWPLTLPACAGALVANHFASEDRAKAKATRKDRDHQRRLEELAAEQRLACEQKQRTLADIEFLVQNGIHAEVSGLYEGD